MKAAAGDFDGALADALAACAEEPHVAYRHEQAALILWRQGKHAKARKLFDAALLRFPRDSRLWMQRAHLRQSQGDLDGALADAEEALRFGPDETRMHLFRGQILHARREWEAALADYAEAIRRSPCDFGAYVRRSEIRELQGDLDGALADAESGVRFGPSDPLAFKRRGLLRKVRKDFQGAAEDFTAALALRPGVALYHSERGACRLELGDAEGAAEDFTAALAVRPSVNDRRLRSAARRLQGNWVGCVEDLRIVAELSSSSPEAWRMLAEVRASAPDARARDGMKAVENARTACELSHWSDAASVQTLAAAYAESGNFAEAVLRQRKAAAMFAAEGDASRIAQAEARLREFQAKRPYRLTAAAPL